jgi:hypothetical protein
MSRKRRADTQAIVGALTVAFLAAAVFYLGLSLISLPGGFSGRLAEVDQQTADAERILVRSGTGSPYQVGAVCNDYAAATAQLRQQLQTQAASAGLTLTNFSAVPGAPDEALGGLRPQSLIVEASGRYDAVVGLLGALAKSQPQIFVDTLDLKSQTSSVALKLSGRFFCSTLAPL